jgi:hypothetical protein
MLASSFWSLRDDEHKEQRFSCSSGERTPYSGPERSVGW